MNHLVEIKYSKSGRYPQVFINGDAISRYMSLSDYIYDDIFCWADNFFDIIDSELAENYEVAVIGHQYHEIALRASMNKSEYCQGISFTENEYKISVEDKYNYVMALNAKHSVVPGQLGHGLEFYCTDAEAFEALGVPGLILTEQNSAYSIGFEGCDPGALTGKYRVIIGEREGAMKQQGAMHLYITREHLPILIDYLNTYHLRLSVVEEVFSKLSDCSLDEMTRLEFEAYNNEEYRVVVSEIPSVLESGTSFEVNYRYFPECFEDPKIRVTLDNHSVVALENGICVAKEPGICTIRMTDAAGVEYASQEIEVFRHNYVRNIAVNVPDKIMEIGDTISFSTVITPTDAEDINEITYSVSDESIVILNGQNQLYAVSSGKAKVTVSTPRVSRSFEVTVAAEPTDIVLSEESVTVASKSEATVTCTIVPEGVSQNTKVLWAVSNKEIVRIKGSNSKRCCIEGASVGSAVLMCKIEGTNIIKKIPVTVTKKKGCYVATAVYGTYDCPEVWVLRRFRDNFLQDHWLGRRFIDVYYATSPKAVELFGKKKWFNRFFKISLDKFVSCLQKNGYDETPYED